MKLQENASLLDRAEFAAKFITIAEEYNRLQLFRQYRCTTLLPSESPIEFIERRFVTADGVIEWNEQVKGYLLQKLGQ